MIARHDIAARLRDLAAEMLDLGAAMDYYGGFDALGEHGRELVGAGHIARTWAEEIDLSAEAAP